MIKCVTGIRNIGEKALRSLLKHGTTFFSYATDLELYYSATENNLQIQPVTHFNIYWEQNESLPVAIYDFITDTNFSQSSMSSFIQGLLQPASSSVINNENRGTQKLQAMCKHDTF
jgi:type IV secretory pathway VirD2 relaxase